MPATTRSSRNGEQIIRIRKIHPVSLPPAPYNVRPATGKPDCRQPRYATEEQEHPSDALVEALTSPRTRRSGNPRKLPATLEQISAAG